MIETLRSWLEQVRWEHIVTIVLGLAFVSFVRFLSENRKEISGSMEQVAAPAARRIELFEKKVASWCKEALRAVILWLKPHILPFLASYGVLLGLGTLFGELREEELWFGFPAAALGATYLWHRSHKSARDDSAKKPKLS